MPANKPQTTPSQETAGAVVKRDDSNKPPAQVMTQIPAISDPAPAASVLPAQPVPPTVSPGRMKRRHYGVIYSFLLLVAAPAIVAAWYLWTRAMDQYASTVGFSVQTEEVSSAIEILGGISELSGSSSSDTDILYEYIQSQKLVSDIDTKLDLRGLWSWPRTDPVFTFDAPGSIEDLVTYWKRMVRVNYETATGLIEVRVLAFRPEDATTIAQTIFAESTTMINALSDIAREDAIRYAREELDTAVERLKQARQAITDFRNRHQIVDPEADIQIQVGLLAMLQSQLAEALIEYELLIETTRTNDPRITQADRRVRIIRSQIAEERSKLGIGDGSAGGSAYAAVIGEYEHLTVDREFAEQTYTGSLVNYDSALAEARRQSRYLAAYVLPTVSEEAQYPQRGILLSLLGLFLFMFWGIATLVFYSLKDRR